jgi:hypothetical protein
MKRLAVLLVLLIPAPLAQTTSGDYVIKELRDENATASPPFSISRVAPFGGRLRLFIRTDNPEAVAALLDAGALEAQLSDHQSETASTVSLSLGVAVSCVTGDAPVYQGYSGTMPACGGEPPANIEYYFEVAVTLGPGRDLAIGQDPDFLWLVEER